MHLSEVINEWRSFSVMILPSYYGQLTLRSIYFLNRELISTIFIFLILRLYRNGTANFSNVSL